MHFFRHELGQLQATRTTALRVDHVQISVLARLSVNKWIHMTLRKTLKGSARYISTFRNRCTARMKKNPAYPIRAMDGSSTALNPRPRATMFSNPSIPQATGERCPIV